MSEGSKTDGKLEGKVAVVTGAAKGIGESIAYVLSREGAEVVVADVDRHGGEETVSHIEKKGGKAVFIKCDVRDWEKGGDCETLVEKVLEDFGRIDILVNNAGAQTEKPLLDLEPEDIRNITCLNYLGPFRLIKLVSESMIEREIEGSIVNITSIHSKEIRDFPEYSSSKAALNMLTKEAAYRLGEYGIRVNAVAPGATDTPMNRRQFSDPEIRNKVARKTPLGRIGKGEDIAEAVLFLASDDASFITGEEITVDGGLSLRNVDVEDIEFSLRED